jgi:glycerol-3-phosphate acyltransferase PlsY
MSFQALCVSSLAGYVLGSIPAGYLAGRLAGVDIRAHGSGNIGATNVLRVLGKKYGYTVFLFDFMKGFGAVLLAEFIRRQCNSNGALEVCGISGGVAAVAGHSYPVWLGFKGGKGVATSLGVLTSLIPIAALIMIAVWGFTFLMTRYVSVASVSAAAALPVATAWLLYRGTLASTALLYFAIGIAVFVIWRHRSNIIRLWQGTEPRFQRK